MALEPAAAPYNGSKLWGTAPNGYTIGPNYWGMTFYAWPPDPNNDWRQLYFLNSSGAPWTIASVYPPSASGYPNNNVLFAGSGIFNSPPTGNYQINYKAILAWINANCVQKSVGDGRPFPPVLRSSNQIFYSYIPTDVPVSAYTWSNPNSQITDPSVRFWKEYIDFVIGVWQDPTGTIQLPGTSTCSYGTDFTAGALSGGSGVSISGVDATVYLNGLVKILLPASDITRCRPSPSAPPPEARPSPAPRRHHIQREGYRHHRYQPRLRI